MNAPATSVAAIGSDVGARAAGHIDAAFRRILPRTHAEVERSFVRVSTGAGHPLGNVLLLDAGASAEDSVRGLAPLVSGGRPSAVLRYGPSRPGVEEAIRAAGFTSQPPMPAMAADIDALGPTELPPRMRFEAIAEVPDRDGWIEAFAAGYALPVEVAGLFGPTERVEGCQWFAIRASEGIVATSLLVLDRGLAGIYCVATRPEARGQGLGAHATAEPLRLARALGYRVGVLQSSEAGHSIYRRLGFSDVGAVALDMRFPT